MAIEKGLIQVYTGNGKGKTTAAMGLALRAIGAGLKVFMIQFMKGRRYSEIDAIEQIPEFEVRQFGRDEFVSKKNPEQIDINSAHEGLSFAHSIISGGKHDIVILDEINVALDFKLIPLKEVLNIISDKPKHVEIICTGRYAPPELIAKADLVTDIGEVKHPYQQGTKARKGIDW